jgi:hypothetical protein
LFEFVAELTDAKNLKCNDPKAVELRKHLEKFEVMSEVDLVMKLKEFDFKTIVDKKKSIGKIGKHNLKIWDYPLKKTYESREDAKTTLIIYSIEKKHIDTIGSGPIELKKPLIVDFYGNIGVKDGTKGEFKKHFSLHEHTKKKLVKGGYIVAFDFETVVDW